MNVNPRKVGTTCELVITGPDDLNMAQLAACPLEVWIAPVPAHLNGGLVLRAMLPATRPIEEHVSRILGALAPVKPALVRATDGAECKLLVRVRVETMRGVDAVARLVGDALRDAEVEFHAPLLPPIR